jgi:signal transduction histidine kinase
VAELSEAITLMAATLEQRARYIVGFAASVSHEFKTPMAAIKAAAELLDDGSGTLQPEDRQHLLGVVSDGVVRLERLVRRLVELARADMTRVANAATEVGPVLRRVADRYLVRGMAISLSCDEGAVALPADALDAMVTSLLDNAAAHAAGAGVTVTSETKGGEVRITVRDSGPGIREADRDRVFEPFFTTGRAAGGTGLGLPIVRAIASGGGGSVNLLPGDSGAAFLVRLPAAA